MSAQDIDVKLLNEIITDLIGDQDNIDIPIYESISHACNSDYISCKKGKIIGLNFQFSNLNGHVPKNITKLKNLEWIDLDYNYLSGPLPNGFSALSEIKELRFNGNFITGPLPLDLTEVNKKVVIDLSENVIDIGESKIKRRCNIINQVNLEGCRSPDSIYISKNLSLRKKDKDTEIEIDTSAIEVNELPETQDSTLNQDDKKEFKMVESMPRFPGCEGQGLEEKEVDECAKLKMLQFIYKTLKYPALARERGIEGMAVVQFTILRDGSIGSVVLNRDPGGRTGNSAQWVVNRMNYICDKWKPGIQRGRPVKVLYTLPIKYMLQKRK